MSTIRVSRGDGKTVDEIQWQAQELDIVEKPNGPVVAAIIAAGIGVLALGIFTTWAEASTGMKDWLDFKHRVGPLSGKTIMAVAIYLGSWAVLAPVLWKKNLALATPVVITTLLLVAGFIGTFPKFFQLFA